MCLHLVYQLFVKKLRDLAGGYPMLEAIIKELTPCTFAFWVVSKSHRNLLVDLFFGSSLSMSECARDWVTDSLTME